MHRAAAALELARPDRVDGSLQKPRPDGDGLVDLLLADTLEARRDQLTSSIQTLTHLRNSDLEYGQPATNSFFRMTVADAAEKYLKARLEEAGIVSPKTHDLRRLLNLALPVEPLWAALLHAVASLSVYVVEFRYPGNEATPQDAQDAKQYARAVRKEARLALGLAA